VIAEAKDLKALRLDCRGSRGVFLLGLVGKMLAAIEFDHELGCVTYKIGDEVLDGNLPAEAGTVQSVIAQCSPEDSFYVGGVLAECAGVRAKL
jgi:hypothetical protein